MVQSLGYPTAYLWRSVRIVRRMASLDGSAKLLPPRNRFRGVTPTFADLDHRVCAVKVHSPHTNRPGPHPAREVVMWELSSPALCVASLKPTVLQAKVSGEAMKLIVVVREQVTGFRVRPRPRPDTDHKGVHVHAHVRTPALCARINASNLGAS